MEKYLFYTNFTQHYERQRLVFHKADIREESTNILALREYQTCMHFPLDMSE